MPVVLQSQVTDNKKLLRNIWDSPKEEIRLPSLEVVDKKSSELKLVPLTDNIVIKNLNDTRNKEYLRKGTLVSENTINALNSGLVTVERIRNNKGDEDNSAVYNINANIKSKNSSLPLCPSIVINNTEDPSFEVRKSNILANVLNEVLKNSPIVISTTNGVSPLLIINPSTDKNIYEYINQGYKVKHQERIECSPYNYIDKFIVTDPNGKKSDPILRYNQSPTADTRMKEGIISEILKTKGENISSYVPNPALATEKLAVILQSDCGSFYCGKISSAGTKYVEYNKESSIKKNSSNEHLFGFLHVPSDSYSFKNNSQKSTDELVKRHGANIDVVSTAIRGYFEDYKKINPDSSSFKILLGGFSNFDPIQDNPTGELVKNAKLTELLLAKSFPDYKILSLESKSINESINGVVSRIVLSKADSEKKVSCLLIGQEFLTNNSCIDGGDNSLQNKLTKYKPDSVILLGVSPEKNNDNSYLFYKIPNQLKDLTPDANSDNNAIILPSNYSLSRAISNGHQILNNTSSK